MKLTGRITPSLPGLMAAALCIVHLAASPARARDVLIPGTTDFPESMTATRDGTLFFSSMAGSRIFRAGPGETTAREWVAPGTGGLSSVLGVLADEASGTLYACSVDMSWAGLQVPGGPAPTALALFDLSSGAPKGRLPLPASTVPGQPPLCNDIAVDAGGSAYVTDSLSARILRLRPGATTLEVWAQDPRWEVKGPQLDGIAVMEDGTVYANLFEGDGLYRIERQPDGSAGRITKLRTSRPLFHADGLRAAGPNRLLMVEGETKGTLDLITVTGDEAQVETVQGGFQGPVSLAQLGSSAYVLDVSLKHLFDPALRSATPPPFKATEVPLPR